MVGVGKWLAEANELFAVCCGNYVGNKNCKDFQARGSGGGSTSSGSSGGSGSSGNIGGTSGSGSGSGGSGY